MSLPHAGSLRPHNQNDRRYLVPLNESVTVGIEVIVNDGSTTGVWLPFNQWTYSYEWTTYTDDIQRGALGGGTRPATPLWSVCPVAGTDGGEYLVLGLTYTGASATNNPAIVPFRFNASVEFLGEDPHIPLASVTDWPPAIWPFGANRWLILTRTTNSGSPVEAAGLAAGVLTLTNGVFNLDPLAWVPSFEYFERAAYPPATSHASYSASPGAYVADNHDGRSPNCVYLGDDQVLLNWHSQYTDTSNVARGFDDRAILRYDGSGSWTFVDVQHDVGDFQQTSIYELVPESKFVLVEYTEYAVLMGMDDWSAQDWIGIYWVLDGPYGNAGPGPVKTGAVGGGSPAWVHSTFDDNGTDNDVYIKLGSGPSDRMSVIYADTNWSTAWISGGGVWGNEGGYFFRAAPDFSSYWLVKRDGLYFVENGTQELVRSYGFIIPDGRYVAVEFAGPHITVYVDNGGPNEYEFGIVDSRNEDYSLHGVADRFGASKQMEAYIDVFFLDVLGDQVEMSIIDKTPSGLTYGDKQVVSSKYGCTRQWCFGVNSHDQRLGFFMREEEIGWYLDISPPMLAVEVGSDGTFETFEVLEQVGDTRTDAVAPVGSLLAGAFEEFIPSSYVTSIEYFGEPNYVTFDDSGQRVRFTGVR